jgi:hypothetical protein
MIENRILFLFQIPLKPTCEMDNDFAILFWFQHNIYLRMSRQPPHTVKELYAVVDKVVDTESKYAIRHSPMLGGALVVENNGYRSVSKNVLRLLAYLLKAFFRVAAKLLVKMWSWNHVAIGLVERMVVHGWAVFLKSMSFLATAAMKQSTYWIILDAVGGVVIVYAIVQVMWAAYNYHHRQKSPKKDVEDDTRPPRHTSKSPRTSTPRHSSLYYNDNHNDYDYDYDYHDDYYHDDRRRKRRGGSGDALEPDFTVLPLVRYAENQTDENLRLARKHVSKLFVQQLKSSGLVDDQFKFDYNAV